MSGSTIRSTTLIFIALFLLVWGKAVTTVQTSWRNNAWSLIIARQVITEGEMDISLPVPEGHPRTALWKAQSVLQTGNTNGAQTLLEPLMSQGNPLAFRLWGYTLEHEKEYREAVQTWEQAGDQISLRRIAEKEEQIGSLDNALLAYDALYALDPVENTLDLVKFLRTSQHDYSSAEKVLQHVLGAYPESRNQFSWLRQLGKVLGEQKRWREAEQVILQELALRPDSPNAYLDLGWAIYEGRGDLGAALAALQQAIALAPDNGSGYFNVGKMLAREQRYSEADKWFQKALALNSTVVSWYVVRGNNMRNEGNTQFAIDIFNETLTLFPDNPQVYYELALAYQLDHQLEEAVVAIERALSLMRTPNPNYYVRAGSIYVAYGEMDKALSAYKLALELDPDNESARKGVARLGEK